MEIVQKKICLMGDFAVGKTSLVRRYVEGNFKDKYLSTIGVSISRKTVPRKGYQLNLLLWDLAGGDDFTQYQTSYLRGAAGALLVCDLTRKETLQDLTRFAEEVRGENPNASLIFLANKVDLGNRIELGAQDLDNLSRSWGSPYLFTSAKTGEYVEDAFLLMADKVEQSS